MGAKRGRTKRGAAAPATKGAGRGTERCVRRWVEAIGARDGDAAREERARQEVEALQGDAASDALRDVFRSSEGERRLEILRAADRLPAEHVRPLLLDVLAATETGLEEKRLALRRLRAWGWDEADAREGALREASRVAEQGFPDLLERAGRDAPAWGEAVGQLEAVEPGLRGPLLRELLGRYGGEAIPFVEAVLDARSELLEGLLPEIAACEAESAGRLLSRLHARFPGKKQRKEIKRLHHKRRAAGLPAPELEEPGGPRAVWAPPATPGPEGYLSISESAAVRLAWVMRPGVPKGWLVFSGMLHDQDGLLRFYLQDVTSREGEKYRGWILGESELTVVEADPAYCARLLDEGFERGAPVEPSEAETFRQFRGLLREVKGAGEGHPADRAFKGSEGTPEEVAAEISGSAGLLDEPLLGSWGIEPERLRAYLEPLSEIRGSRIIVHPLQRQEREAVFFRQTVDELFGDGAYRQLWVRRLLDAAWVLHQSGGGRAGLRLWTVARALGGEGRGPSRIPLLVEMVRRGLGEMERLQKTEEGRSPSLIVKPGRKA